MATNVLRCPANCVPDPYLFSKIYGVVKRGQEEKYMELFQTAPVNPETSGKGENGIIVVVLLLFVCFVITVAVLGGVYYFQEELGLGTAVTTKEEQPATT